MRRVSCKKELDQKPDNGFDFSDRYSLRLNGDLLRSERRIRRLFERVPEQDKQSQPPDRPDILAQFDELQGLVTSYFSHSQQIAGDLGRRYEVLLREVRQLEYLCDHDAFLDILNRRGLIRALDTEISQTSEPQTSEPQARDQDAASSFVYVDIDGFKTINDRHGHAQGDQFLKKLVDHIQSQLQKGDHFARLGGDEFGIILARTTIRQALDKASGLARSLAASLACDGHYWGLGASRLTFSQGVTQIEYMDTPEEVIRRADENMYFDKNKKKKRIVGEKYI